MVSLIDLAKSRGTVKVRDDQDFNVVGLTARNIIEILVQFPEIRKILTSNIPDPEVVEQLAMRFPDAAALIIVAGTGVDVSDREKADPLVAAARELPLGEQFDIFQKILDLTFPRSVKSFLDGVRSLIGQAGGPGWAPVTTSPVPSSGASPMEEPKMPASTQPQSS
jgi:hypothetical protein